MSNFQPPEEKAKLEIKPPKITDILLRILKYWASKGGRSNNIPRGFAEASEWWVNHQEPADEYRDRPQKRTNKDGEIVGWETPYHDRVAATLRKFLTLPHIHQVYVIEKIEDGIPWRGDNMDMFMEIVKESEKMERDKDAYIRDAFRVLKGFRFPQIEV